MKKTMGSLFAAGRRSMLVLGALCLSRRRCYCLAGRGEGVVASAAPGQDQAAPRSASATVGLVPDDFECGDIVRLGIDRQRTCRGRDHGLLRLLPRAEVEGAPDRANQDNGNDTWNLLGCFDTARRLWRPRRNVPIRSIRRF